MRILCVLLLVLPLLFPGPCAEGVRRGLALAAGSALPALFPFFVAGELLTASLPTGRSRAFSRPCCAAFSPCRRPEPRPSCSV